MCGSSQYSCSRMKASRAAPKLSTTSHRILLDPHLLRYGWTTRCSSARNGEGLKARVTIGSAESAALEAGKRFGSEVFSPEPITVKCTFATATRLLAVAYRFCPEVVPKIRAAIEQEKQ